MTTSENFSPEQSLKLIQAMIDKAKSNVKGDGFYFLMWGWLVFIAAILNFILMKFTTFERPYLAWTLLLIGAVISVIKGIKAENKVKVKTYLSETMNYFGISLGILYGGLAFVFGYYNLWEQSFPIYILLYGVGCFFMGSLLQFNFLKWGGLLCIPVMVASLFVSYQWQLLFMAFAVLVSYIIPGHILNAKPK